MVIAIAATPYALRINSTHYVKTGANALPKRHRSGLKVERNNLVEAEDKLALAKCSPPTAFHGVRALETMLQSARKGWEIPLL